MREFIISGFADELDSDINQQITGFSELGIRNMEIRFINEKNIADLSEKEVSDLKKLLDQHDIQVSAIGSPLGKVSLDDDFQVHILKCRQVFEYANILGAKRIRMFSFYPHADAGFDAEAEKEVFERIEKMLNLAEKHGVILCHENEHGIYGESPESCKKLLDTFGGSLKAVFDMGNFCLDGHDPISAYQLLKPYISYFHIKDGTNDGIVVPPGMGEAKIKEILALHTEDAKETLISLEPHLVDFCGLGQLVKSEVVKKISYNNSREAFFDAAKRVFSILEEIEN